MATRSIQQTGYLTDLLGDRAVDAIEGHAENRRAVPAEPALQRAALALGGAGRSGRVRAAAGREAASFDGGSQKTYARMVQAMDPQIGRVLQALDAHGLTENTIVIFTSDNGGERFSDTWPFTGIKTELLEGGLRVPALICWPARIEAGRCQRSGLDLHGLVSDPAGGGRCGAGGAHPPDGISLLPVLTGRSAPVPRTLFWRYRSNAQRAMRDGDFKYLKIRDNTFLFNVVEDPRERANLKDRRKDVYDRMEAAWHVWAPRCCPRSRTVSARFTPRPTSPITSARDNTRDLDASGRDEPSLALQHRTGRVITVPPAFHPKSGG